MKNVPASLGRMYREHIQFILDKNIGARCWISTPTTVC